MGVWFACAFEKAGRETLVHRVRADGLSDDVVRRLWSIPPGSPVLGEFPVTEDDVDRVQPFVPELLDLGAYHWFLSSDTD